MIQCEIVIKIEFKNENTKEKNWKVFYKFMDLVCKPTQNDILGIGKNEFFVSNVKLIENYLFPVVNLYPQHCGDEKSFSQKIEFFKNNKFYIRSENT